MECKKVLASAMLLKKTGRKRRSLSKKMKFDLTCMSKCSCYDNVKWHGEIVHISGRDEWTAAIIVSSTE